MRLGRRLIQQQYHNKVPNPGRCSVAVQYVIPGHSCLITVLGLDSLVASWLARHTRKGLLRLWDVDVNAGDMFVTLSSSSGICDCGCTKIIVRLLNQVLGTNLGVTLPHRLRIFMKSDSFCALRPVGGAVLKINDPFEDYKDTSDEEIS